MQSTLISYANRPLPYDYIRRSVNPSIGFNPTPKSLAPYTLSLRMHSTLISYVRPNMIDFSILIMSVKYVIRAPALVITNMKKQKRLTRKLD